MVFQMTRRRECRSCQYATLGRREREPFPWSSGDQAGDKRGMAMGQEMAGKWIAKIGFLGVCTATVLAFIAGRAASAEPASPATTELPKPDPEVQEQIQRLSSLCLGSTGKPVGSSDYERKMQVVIKKLGSMRKDGKNILLELLLYRHRIAGSDLPRRQKESAYYSTIPILQHLYCDGRRPRKPELVQGVAPLIKTEDPFLRKEIKRILKMVSYGLEQYDFVSLEPLIAAHMDDPPLVVLEHMHSLSPTEAFRSMMNIYARDVVLRQELLSLLKPIETDDIFSNRKPGRPRPTEETKTKAVEALEKMASHKQWWVRLYAKSMLAMRPRYRSLGLAKKTRAKLERDEHSLVRELFRQRPPRPRKGLPGT